MPTAVLSRPLARRVRRLGALLAAVTLLGAVGGLVAGSSGGSIAAIFDPAMADVVWQIRAPRTLGAWLTGVLLGLAGAIAQGLFRNPLADPYLLGSAAGAGLGVVVVLSAGTLVGHGLQHEAAQALMRVGLLSAAFFGALAGVGLTLLLARGAQQGVQLLLAGVVVGVVMGAVSDLLTTLAPDALRGRHAFMLGNTGFLGWDSCAVMAAAVIVVAPLAQRCSRALDALALGEDSALSLGLPLARVRWLLVVLLAGATGTAVAQAGLVAFVGLVAPHLVRRSLHATHGVMLLASGATGGALLLASDVAARVLIAPQELPVGVLTGVLGGSYLLWLLHRRAWR